MFVGLLSILAKIKNKGIVGGGGTRRGGLVVSYPRMLALIELVLGFESRLGVGRLILFANTKNQGNQLPRATLQRG